MSKFFTLLACIGILGIGWTGLPLALNYFSIGLIIISAIYFGFPKTHDKNTAAGPLIFMILLSTMVDIALIQDRMRESFGRRLSYIQEVIPIYSGNLFTTDASLFIINDLVGMTKWISALLFFPMLFGFNSKRQQVNIKLLLNIWIIAVIINVTVAILNSRGLVFSFVSNDVSEEIGANRFSGLSSHPNHLSTVISLTLPLALYAIQNSKFPKLNYFIVPYLLTGQLLTGSRIGLISFAFALLLGFKFVLRIGTTRYIGQFLALIILTIFVMPNFSLGPDLFESRLFSGGEGIVQSNTARLALAQQGLADFIGDPMVGIGPRAFKSSHNIFLQLLASLGILGFLAFMYLLKQSVGVSTYKDSFTYALRISILSILVTGIFSNGLADFFIYLPFGAILGTISRRRVIPESRTI